MAAEFARVIVFKKCGKALGFTMMFSERTYRLKYIIFSDSLSFSAWNFLSTAFSENILTINIVFFLSIRELHKRNQCA